jgi:Fur family ferric uptake transcriptional regulator
MKSNLNLQASQMLKAAKLYCTKCRVSILKVLAKADKPLSQGQIAQRLGKNRLNKVTIYRTLENFCQAGLVHRAFIHKRAAHFELANRCSKIRCHPHFTCTSCGAIHCLTETSLPMVKSPYKGFIIGRQRVQLEGLCPKCNPNL